MEKERKKSKREIFPAHASPITERMELNGGCASGMWGRGVVLGKFFVAIRPLLVPDRPTEMPAYRERPAGGGPDVLNKQNIICLSPDVFCPPA